MLHAKWNSAGCIMEDSGNTLKYCVGHFGPIVWIHVMMTAIGRSQNYRESNKKLSSA